MKACAFSGRSGPMYTVLAPALPRPVHKVRRWIHVARGPDHHHHRRLRNLALDPIHLQRSLAEEHDMRPQATAAGAAPNFSQVLVDRPILDWLPAALSFAARLRQLAVHVQQSLRSGTLMQIVYILCTQKESVA